MNEQRRKQLREWIKERVEDQDSVDLPELADEAVKFFSEKPHFVRDIMGEMLRGHVYEIGQNMLKSTHGEPVVMLGETAVTQSEFKRRSGALSERFSRWMEHTGDQYERLTKLTSVELLNAAGNRERRANTEIAVAKFLRRVASGLSEGQRVEERYSATELEALWTNAEQEVAA